MDEVGWQMQSGISIHAPQWGATAPRTMQSRPTRYFNPRTPVGCDGMAWELCPAVLRFQSTHPSGVRRFIGCTTIMSRCNFNPRTPVGCDVSADTGTPVSMNFNPRTPVGCDIVGDDVVPDALISIHAPQWGATCPSSSLLVLVIVFQSTHPSGVRRAPITKVRQARYFNPRTPVGCDRRPAIAGNPQRPISIHAPQWGATRTGTTITNGFTHFNPRTPVGCDRKTNTTHKGGNNFNPRTPVGCDGIAPDKRLEAVIFQSTHPSGVRPTATRTAIRVCNFNPRTPVGCDDPSRRSRRDQGYFNPRTPVGCDRAWARR